MTGSGRERCLAVPLGTKDLIVGLILNDAVSTTPIRGVVDRLHVHNRGGDLVLQTADHFFLRLHF